MKFIKQLSSSIYAFERILAVVLLSLMVSLVTIGVIFRYFLNSPLSWSDEFALYALVWITFVGGSMSIHRKKAAAVSLVMERIPPRLSKPLILIGATITLLFCIYLFYTSFQWIIKPMVLKQKSTTGMSMIVPYVVIPLSFCLMSIHSLALCFSADPSEQSEES